MRRERKSEMIGHIIRECRAHQIDLHFVAEKTLSGTAFTGSFDGTHLEVAAKWVNWISVLVHEYAHVQQWNAHLWDDTETRKLFEDLETWEAGTKELSDERLLLATRTVQAMELDAEKRAYRLLKRYSIRMNYSKHIQSCNAYVLGYEVVRKTRRRQRKPITPGLAKLCPTTWIRSLEKLPDGFEKHFLRYYT